MVMSVATPVTATEEEYPAIANIADEMEPEDATVEILNEPVITVTPEPTATPEPIATEIPEATEEVVPDETEPVQEEMTPDESALLPTPDPSVIDQLNNLEQYDAEEVISTEFGDCLNYGFYMDTPTISPRSARTTSGTYGKISWVFDDVTGTLTLTGSGEMEKRLSTTVFPWDAHANSITKIVIGSGITAIGEAAFFEYAYLTTVTLANTVTTINKAAFADCLSLSDIVLPEGVRKVEAYAFQRCAFISFKIPKTLTFVSELAFFNCYNLSNISVTAGNSAYSATNNVLYSRDKKTLLLVPYGHSAVNLSIPNGTVVIGTGAFLNTSVKTVNFPNTLKEIREGAFYGAGITSLTIPDSVTKLGLDFARDCWQLKEVKIGNGVKELPERAFAYCLRLEKVTLPRNMKIISRAAFGACSALKSVTLPANVETIGMQAFFGCPLASISFPNKIKEISAIAFWNTLLTKVTLPSSIEVVGYDAFPRNCQVIYPSGLVPMGDGSYMKVATLYVDSHAKYNEAFAVLKIVNQERKKAGRSELKMDKDLLNAAMIRADELSILWSHDRPTGLDCFSASPKMSGENIALGSINAKGVMNQWMNSPGHKGNILSARFKSIGIGCVVIDGTTYWVQCFGTDSATTASASSYKDQKKEAAIRVNPRIKSYKPRLRAAKTKLDIGKKTTLTYQCYSDWRYSDIKAKSFTFTSSDKNVCTVNASGKVTAKGVGTATITAYPKGFPDIKKSVKITVKGKAPYTISYKPKGGKGKLTSTKTEHGKTVRLRANKFKRNGYKFSGWTVYRKSDKKWMYVKAGKTNWYKKGAQPAGYKLKVYKNKAKVKNLSGVPKDKIIMYAKWKKK